jgi:hypothetical protein
MLPKPFTLKEPVDQFAVPLEAFLTLVAGRALQSTSGSYTGTGRSITITVPFYAKLIILSPNINLGKAAATTAGNMVFSLASNVGASWVPGTGFVKDCVTAIASSSFTIGTNAAVNTATSSYTYFVIG